VFPDLYNVIIVMRPTLMRDPMRGRMRIASPACHATRPKAIKGIGAHPVEKIQTPNSSGEERGSCLSFVCVRRGVKVLVTPSIRFMAQPLIDVDPP
jgi:hypothetical protein